MSSFSCRVEWVGWDSVLVGLRVSLAAPFSVSSSGNAMAARNVDIHFFFLDFEFNDLEIRNEQHIFTQNVN